MGYAASQHLSFTPPFCMGISVFLKTHPWRDLLLMIFPAKLEAQHGYFNFTNYAAEIIQMLNEIQSSCVFFD